MTLETHVDVDVLFLVAVFCMIERFSIVWGKPN